MKLRVIPRIAIFLSCAFFASCSSINSVGKTTVMCDAINGCQAVKDETVSDVLKTVGEIAIQAQ